MNPLKFKMAMDYLTRAKKVKKSSRCFSCKSSTYATQKESIKTMEAINAFIETIQI